MYGLEHLEPEDVEQVNKALFQFGGQVEETLEVFRMYGMDVYIPRAAEAIRSLAWKLHLRLCGIDEPILPD
jgi:hypothetical protein